MKLFNDLQGNEGARHVLYHAVLGLTLMPAQPNNSKKVNISIECNWYCP